MSQNSRKKTNVLITGSSGFIGKILAKRFSKKYKTYLIDKIKKGKQKNFYLINLKDKKKLNEFFSNNKVDTIIHLAATCGGIQANKKQPGTYFYNNISMGINVIENCRLYGIKKLILVF